MVQQAVQVGIALCENLVQWRAQSVPSEAHRIYEVALPGAVRTDQKIQWAERDITHRNALVVMQDHASDSGIHTFSNYGIIAHDWQTTAAPARCVRSVHSIIAGAANTRLVSQRKPTQPRRS